MARSTPTYTPVRNYAIGFLLSAFILFSDIRYETFANIRAFVHASTLYSQMISRGLSENIGITLVSFQENKNLFRENKELKEQILKIKTRDFIERKDYKEKIQIIDFYQTAIGVFKNDVDIFKIASLDLTNYLCCSSHRIYLNNTSQVQIDKNVPVFAGSSFIGQTKNTYTSFVEVILFSDINHLLPIKSNAFYCDARGIGKPMLISCKVSKNNGSFENVIGDTVFTSGLGGVFLKDIEIGSISGINPLSIDEIEVVITLKANPLEETFYGVMKKVPDEI